MKLNLHDVTLCIADCVTPKLAIRAIQHSLDLCDFARAILFTDKIQDHAISNCEVVQINRIGSINEYSHFLLKQLNEYIQTDFLIVAQWDGYVIDAKGWSNEFRNFDYIGAKWPWHQDGKNIGNGGFSFRSKKLLEATSSPLFQYMENAPEDDLICRTNREYLERNNAIRFATEQIADRFSYERSIPNEPTFGFHGLFNMWRHCNDADMIALIENLSPRTYKSREFLELMVQYFLLRKFEPIAAMYTKARSTLSQSEFTNQIFQLTNDQQFAGFFTDLSINLASRADR